MRINEPRTAREWWYLIAIIVLCEGILLHFIYTKGYDEDAQRAWEFGHVVVAIILAVLAIIYGFLQGESQTHSIARVEEALAMLGNVSRGLESSEAILRTELEKVAAVFPQLQEIKSSVVGTSSALSKIEDKLDKTLKEQNAAIPAVKPSAEHPNARERETRDSPETLETLFANIGGTLGIVLMVLYHLDGKGIRIVAGIERTIYRAQFEVRPEPDETFKKFFHGYLTGLADALSELHLLTDDEKGIVLRPSFKSILAKNLPLNGEPSTEEVFGLTMKYAKELPATK